MRITILLLLVDSDDYELIDDDGLHEGRVSFEAEYYLNGKLIWFFVWLENRVNVHQTAHFLAVVDDVFLVRVAVDR